MNARDEARREYIVGALIEAGAMYPDDARSYLAEHDAAVGAEVLAEAATDLLPTTPPEDDQQALFHNGLKWASAELVRMAGTGMEEKTTPAGAAVTPQPVLTVRQQRLLAAVSHTPGVPWSTGPVTDLYKTWGIHSPRQQARRDLAALCQARHLTATGPDHARRYRLNTQKDGQS